MALAEGEKGEQIRKLLEILSKIPIFEDLSIRYKRLILSISRRINMPQGGVLCKEGGDPDEMYILLIGKLAVSIKGSGTIATINPIGTIGEMGVFTDEKRSATVTAMTNCALLAIRSLDLNRLIETEPRFGTNIMRKVIKILAARIQEHNVRIREFQNYIMSQEEKESDSK
ncbi:cyclic nucleotide-binding domain-containing protein [bacterium]|nr:cyclic nucleotide-binding domain-containing protein [bacterium]